MVTITSSTNYLEIASDNTDEKFSIRKAAISKIKIKGDKINIYEIGTQNPVASFELADVTSPVAGDIGALYTALIGYL